MLLCCCDAKVIQDNCPPLLCTYIFASPTAVVIHQLDLWLSLSLSTAFILLYHPLTYWGWVTLWPHIVTCKSFQGGDLGSPRVIPILGSETTMSRGAEEEVEGILKQCLQPCSTGKRCPTVACFMAWDNKDILYPQQIPPPFNSHSRRGLKVENDQQSCLLEVRAW